MIIIHCIVIFHISFPDAQPHLQKEVQGQPGSGCLHWYPLCPNEIFYQETV